MSSSDPTDDAPTTPTPDTATEAASSSSSGDAPSPGKARRMSLSTLVRSAVDASVTGVTDALSQIQTALTKFDDENHLKEKASDFLAPHLERAQEATAKIGQIAGSLRTSAEVPVSAMTSALARCTAAYGVLRERAAEFDAKHKGEGGLIVVASPML